MNLSANRGRRRSSVMSVRATANCSKCRCIVETRDTYDCLDCNLIGICDICVISHTKKGHKVIDKRSGERPVMCQTHNAVCKMFCNTCDKGLCYNCLKNHSTHDTQEYDVASSTGLVGGLSADQLSGIAESSEDVSNFQKVLDVREQIIANLRKHETFYRGLKSKKKELHKVLKEQEKNVSAFKSSITMDKVISFMKECVKAVLDSYDQEIRKWGADLQRRNALLDKNMFDTETCIEQLESMLDLSDNIISDHFRRYERSKKSCKEHEEFCESALNEDYGPSCEIKAPSKEERREMLIPTIKACFPSMTCPVLGADIPPSPVTVASAELEPPDHYGVFRELPKTPEGNPPIKTRKSAVRLSSGSLRHNMRNPSPEGDVISEDEREKKEKSRKHSKEDSTRKFSKEKNRSSREMAESKVYETTSLVASSMLHVEARNSRVDLDKLESTIRGLSIFDVTWLAIKKIRGFGFKRLDVEIEYDPNKLKGGPSKVADEIKVACTDMVKSVAVKRDSMSTVGGGSRSSRYERVGHMFDK